jgi:hypothetical protein
MSFAMSAPVWPCFSRVTTLPMSWRYAATAPTSQRRGSWPSDLRMKRAPSAEVFAWR